MEITQETIIYRLVNYYKEFRFFALIAIFYFLGPVGPTDTLIMGMGPQNSTKNLAHLVDLLDHLLSRNCDLGPPLKVNF